MKRVLLVSEYFFPNIGGVENSIDNLAKEYIKLGYQVDIITSDKNLFTKAKLVNEEVVSEYLTIYRYHIPKVLAKVSFVDFIFSRKLFKIKSKNEYTKIITRTHVNFLSLYYYFRGRCPINYIVPGFVFEQNKSQNVSRGSFLLSLLRRVNSFFGSNIQKFAVNNSKLLVFSLAMYDSALELLNDETMKPTLTKPGVNDFFEYLPAAEVKILRDEIEFDNDSFYLLSVGRFVSAKGFSYALESLLYLPDNYKLILAGSGLEEGLYLDYISEHNLSDRVKILSDFNDIPLLYKIADVYLFTSIYEPLGQVILEAGASGLPLVAFMPSDTVKTAIKEIEIDDNIVLVEDVNGIALAESIKNLNFIKSYHISRDYKKRYSWLSLVNDID
ncbi:hypothetical protein OAI_11450 [Vibrio cyclitrophicus FF160]|uniref:glycosyltransferase family 4 protein n=1 Tax=Vibrio cyclitrophicus TaxID=47951 RepID=UPI0002EF1204|nr:glycosyltransferase family 4 protein [Vibrio cyclitrophicus]OEE81584.1 hypothetical protein OAI_11450 [Vibrio cyclitrophicus FF160]